MTSNYVKSKQKQGSW